MAETQVEVGKRVAAFTSAGTSGDVALPLEPGKHVVLYFYPKDSTPGCTTETREFGDAAPAFDAADAVIFGVSRDSLESHLKFKQALDIPFDLLSDPDERLCAQFGVIKLKNMYGKQVRGIERSTFLIDAGGVLVRAWRGVKVPGHVDEVLAAVRAM